jgi:hypothetical protein
LLNYKRSQKASTFLEFVIVFPVFFLFFLALVDFARYWSSTLVLQYGLNEGARLASKINDFEHDVVTNPSPEQKDKIERFLISRNKILSVALEFPLATVINYDNLNKFLVKDTIDTEKEYGVLVVRPGEWFKYKDSSDIYSYKSEWSGTDVPKILTEYVNGSPNGTSENSLMRNFPFALYAEYRFHWIMPFMSESIIRIRALGFREKVWDGTVPEEFSPPKIPTQVPTWTPRPPTYTPTATSTYTVSNTPTSTSTNTATGTETYTPSITETPTETYTPSITYTPSNTATPITPTATYTASYTYTPSNTPTNTATFTFTPTYTATGTSTITYTPSQTYTPTETYTPSITSTHTYTYTPTPTYTASLTFTPSATSTNTYTPSITPTASHTYTPSITPSNTPTELPTDTPTEIPTKVHGAKKTHPPST